MITYQNKYIFIEYLILTLDLMQKLDTNQLNV